MRLLILLSLGFVSAFPAFAATVHTVDSDGVATSDELALDDVCCRFDGKKLTITTGGEKNVQFVTSVDDFAVLPITRSWKGTTNGNGKDTVFQQPSGTRWTSGSRTRCDVALERDEAETKIEIKCVDLVDLDTKRPGLQHVVAKQLACANAKLAAR